MKKDHVGEIDHCIFGASDLDPILTQQANDFMALLALRGAYVSGQRFPSATIAKCLETVSSNTVLSYTHPAIGIISFGVASVQDMIAAAKARPGDILYATAGKGTATHLAGELFGMMAGVKMTAVHYRGGGELVKDLVSGEIKVTFSTIPPVLDFIRKGTVRGIATTALRRDPSLPELPTIAEAALPGYDVRLWLGLLAPAGTPPEVVARLSSADALKAEDVKSVLAAQGFDTLTGTPATFDAFMRSEIAKWDAVVKQIGTLDN
jgi:tripartite-type tricarboxylate transporter receptor subunit TctC